MRRLSILRQLLAATAIAVVTLTGVATDTGASAQSRAGLIVDHGDGRLTYVLVQFEEEKITGAELIDRSGLPVTEVTFGALGVGVCAIDETGCDVGTCRKRVCQGPKPDDPYWQYFTRSAEGSWQIAALGLNSDTVTDGAVRAFAWSANVPAYPPPSIDEVEVKAGALGGNGVAVTRYQADGSVDTGTADHDDSDLPYAGFAVVGLAVVVVGGVVLRRRSGGWR